MSSAELTRSQVRRYYRGSPELLKVILGGMDGGWRVFVSGGYPRMVDPHSTPEEPIKPLRLPKTPGKGDSVAATRIKGRLSKCPDRHDLLG
jgi:hypothetical protein